MHIPAQPLIPLYSTPVLIFDGVNILFQTSSSSSSSYALPANWFPIGPVHLDGYAEPVAAVNLAEFLRHPHITARILLYLGDYGSFDLWQLRTLLRGLQDPLTQVIVVGKTPALQELHEGSVLLLDPAEISPLYLLSTHSVTAVVSFCDGLLVQTALHADVAIICIPSQRNQRIVHQLQTAHRAVVFPDGYWAESTVRESMRKVVSLAGKEKRAGEEERAWERAKNDMSEERLSQLIELSSEHIQGVESSDEQAWMWTW